MVTMNPAAFEAPVVGRHCVVGACRRGENTKLQGHPVKGVNACLTSFVDPLTLIAAVGPGLSTHPDWLPF